MAMRDIATGGRPLAAQFKQYVASGVWQCPSGAAHFWVFWPDGQWHCAKCDAMREFKCPNAAMGDRGDAVAMFGVRGIFDASGRVRV